MLIETLEHLDAVLNRFRSLWKTATVPYLAMDTETQAKPGYDREDALVIHRADVTLISMSYMSEGYVLQTEHYSENGLPVDEVAKRIRPIAEDIKVACVFHHANYDLNVLIDMGIPVWRRVWCTMIAAWLADEEMGKSLKERAQLLGRVLNKMKSVNTNSLAEFSEYAEVDAISTDELFLVQRLGFLNRSKTTSHLNARGELEVSHNYLPAGRLELGSQLLTLFERQWMNNVELPVMRSTVRAEQMGVPVDVNALKKIRNVLAVDWKKAADKVADIAGVPLNVGSSKQLIEFFKKSKVAIPGKTQKGAPSVNAKTLNKMRNSHPIVNAILEYRALEKLQTTYIGVKDSKERSELGIEYYVTDGMIHTTIGTVNAITGRCLHASTEVITDIGPITIEKLFNAFSNGTEIKVLTKNNRYMPVIYACAKPSIDLYCLAVGTGTYIIASKDHLIFTPSGKEVPVSDLTAGDFVTTNEGPAKITSIAYFTQDWAYDIEVQEDASFYANKVLVHNSSSSNPNLQNIPASKDKYALRSIFIAGKYKGLKMIMVVLDYAQLELRVGSMHHQDPVMIKILCDPKGDLHQKTADEFRVPRNPVSKQINFLFQFGGEEYALAENLTFAGYPMTPDEAKPYKQRYDEVYAKVRPWRKSLLDFHAEHGHVLYLSGRKRRYKKGINFRNKWELHKAETTLANNLIQGDGQDFLKSAIVRADWQGINPDKAILTAGIGDKKHRLLIADYAKKLEKYRNTLKLAKATFRLQIHDEAIWICDEKAASEVLSICAEIMCMRRYMPINKPYCVPMVVDGGVGYNWKEAKSKNNKVHIEYGFQNEVDTIK